jgi:hypothetical protein
MNLAKVSSPPVNNNSKNGEHKKLREKECRRVLELIYGKPFPSVRPSFLKNPKPNGGLLELDCYNEELGIALEHQGQQHYNFPNKFHKTEKEFLDNVARDRFKKKVCDMNNIYLITVPDMDRLHFRDIEKYIRSNLPED